MSKKPSLVYFHRYPIDYENLQVPSTKNLLNYLSKDFDIHYFSMKTNNKINPELRKNITIHEIPFTIDRTNSRNKLFKTLLYYLYMPIALSRLRKINPDMIWAREPLPIVPSLLMRLNTPVAVETSDWWWSVLLGKFSIGRKIAQFLESLDVHDWNRFNTIAIAHTNHELKMIEEKGLSKEKIKIINAPIYSGTFFPYKADKERQKLGFKKEMFVVAMQGIIHPNKGYEQVLEWWKELIKIHPNWKLLIIGGAGKEKDLLKKIIKLGLNENVIMAGWLPSKDDVNKYLNAANCLLVTRRNSPENFGIVPSASCYCLATGKPVVATKLPGIAEIIRDKVDGFLFEPDNYESFKKILEYVCQNPKQAEKIGKNGIKRSKDYFSQEKSIKKYSQVLKQYLASFN